jgi:hypothetical protein
MTRSDLLSSCAIVLALAAVYVGLRPKPAPDTPPDYVTKQDLADALEKFKDEGQFVRGMGFLRLEKLGSECRVSRETKVTVRAYPEATVYWLVDNQCAAQVKLTTAERKKADPNNTNPKVDDPFAAAPENPSVPLGTSVVSGVMRKLSEFNPDDKTKIDKFKFKWQVNGRNQPDPEIEIDYRRR